MQRKSALFVLALCFSFFFPCVTAWAAAGSVQSLKPDAWATHAGKRLAIAVGDAIEQAYSLHTGASGNLGVRFSDGSEISLGGNTSIEVRDFVFDSSSSPSLTLNLLKGAARVVTGAVVEQNPEGFKLSTPLGGVGVRGTTLDVQVMPNSVRVTVIDMSRGHDVIVTGLDGKSVRITRPGMQVTLQRGQPTPSSPSLVLRGQASPEISQKPHTGMGEQSVQHDNKVANLVTPDFRMTTPAFIFNIDINNNADVMHFSDERIASMSGDGGTVVYAVENQNAGVTNTYEIWRAGLNKVVSTIEPQPAHDAPVVSRDGNVIAISTGAEIFIFDRDGTPQIQNNLGGGEGVYAMNYDGSVMVGVAGGAPDSLRRWEHDGVNYILVPVLNSLNRDTQGAAYAVSDDGNIMSGGTSRGLTGEPVYWVRDGNTNNYTEHNIQLVSGVPNPGVVLAMTPDGNTMVGQVEDNGGNFFALLHNRVTGVTKTLASPPGTSSEARVISANGQVIGGKYVDMVGTAAFWLNDGVFDAISVVDHLTGQGIQGAPQLSNVYGISEDGTILLCLGLDSNSNNLLYIARIFGEELGLTTFNNVYQSLGGVAAGANHAALATLPVRHLPDINFIDLGKVPSAGEGSEQRWRVWGSGSLLSDYELAEKDYGFEAGAGATYYFAEGWAAGAGAFGAYRRLETGDYDSTQRITSGTLAAYAGYAPARTGLRFSGGLMAQSYDLDSKRRYANGSSVATSSGDDTGWNFGATLHFGWVFDVIDSLTVQPFAEYNFTYSLIPGLKESGGPFPAEYDDENFAQNTVRVGADFEYAITQNLAAQAWAAWNHRFEDEGPELSGRFIGWNNFDLPGAELKQDWGDAGIGISWRFKPSMSLNTSAGFGFGNEDSGLPDMTLRCVLNIDL